MNHLYRSKTNRIIAGVCGGIGEYLNVDPTIIRLIAVALGFMGMGILIYLIAVIIIPEQNNINVISKDAENIGVQEHDAIDELRQKRRVVFGVLLLVLGVVFLGKQMFYWFDEKYFGPVILILVGGYIIFRGERK
jgi:phage shock protein C